MFGSIFGKKKQRFASPFTGELRSITETPDEAFAEKMNGDGFMVSPSDGVVLAPADSVVNFVFETKHALGLTTTEGLEYLLHVGIDTVKLKGEGFTVYVSEGQKVKKAKSSYPLLWQQFGQKQLPMPAFAWLRSYRKKRLWPF